jgi:hypothetical protein
VTVITAILLKIKLLPDIGRADSGVEVAGSRHLNTTLVQPLHHPKIEEKVLKRTNPARQDPEVKSPFQNKSLIL